MNYFILILFLFNNGIPHILSKNQNLFELIINNMKSKTDYESSYIIKDEIEKIFEVKENMHIPIYISIIDLTNINRLNISNDRDSYFNNYNELLGVSDRVYVKNKQNTRKSKNKKVNKIIKVFLNGTIIFKNISNIDEIINDKIIFEKDQYFIDLYFLKNRYMSQYQNINEQNQKLFKFYDMNILFYNNENNLYKGIESNDLVKLEKLENNSILTEKEISNVVNIFVDDFINDNFPLILKKKIINWLKIRNKFNDLLSLEQCKVNLFNFLLIPEIKDVKNKIENIEKNLIPILFFKENENQNFIDFNNSINDLKKSLDKYNVKETDEKIDFYFSIITLFALGLIIFLIFKIYKEFRNSYLKKIKLNIYILSIFIYKKIIFRVYKYFYI